MSGAVFNSCKAAGSNGLSHLRWQCDHFRASTCSACSAPQHCTQIDLPPIRHMQPSVRQQVFTRAHQCAAPGSRRLAGTVLAPDGPHFTMCSPGEEERGWGQGSMAHSALVAGAATHKPRNLIFFMFIPTHLPEPAHAHPRPCKGPHLLEHGVGWGQAASRTTALRAERTLEAHPAHRLQCNRQSAHTYTPTSSQSGEGLPTAAQLRDLSSSACASAAALLPHSPSTPAPAPALPPPTPAPA